MEDEKSVAVRSANSFKGMPVRDIIGQISTIQQLMRKVMHEGEHFGIIPGTVKKTLYKSGAEKIGLLFRLAPGYEVQSKIDESTGHMTVRVKCTLQNINDGKVWGEGLGMASTLESKYRYRAGEGEVTDTPVPKAYWDERKANPKKAQELLGGPGFVAKKVDGRWMIAKRSEEKVEHGNPADHFNTVLKMAKKRAHVDAIITATAASDIFSQDIKEDEEPPVD